MESTGNNPTEILEACRKILKVPEGMSMIDWCKKITTRLQMIEDAEHAMFWPGNKND